jgi:hypothetical protein
MVLQGTLILNTIYAIHPESEEHFLGLYVYFPVGQSMPLLFILQEKKCDIAFCMGIDVFFRPLNEGGIYPLFIIYEVLRNCSFSCLKLSK